MSGTVEYSDPRTAAFRATLDRLPDEIALAIGLHIYDEETLSDGATCVCGWAVREALARECGVAPENTRIIGSTTIRDELMNRFGGSFWEWTDIYGGVTTSEAPLIEEALFDRVMAAALAADKPKSRSGSSRRQRGEANG